MAARPTPKSIPRTLAFLCALGTASSLWAVFLWRELVASRRGGDAFCGFGDDGACAELWDAGFAQAVHDLTGVPVAGWGLVWGLVAFVLPLLALRRRAEGRPDETWRSAVDVVAIAGLVGLAVLVVASVAGGGFCVSCSVTYALTLAYGGLAILSRERETPLLTPRGALTAGAAVLVAWLLLLYPGLETPGSDAEEGQKVLAEAARRADGAPAPAPPAPGSDAEALPNADAALEQMIGGLSAPMRQALADSLAIYRDSPRRSIPEPRSLVGSPSGIRINDFSDILCSHCAALHETYEILEQSLPPGSYGIDSRFFPLDGNCNAHLPARGPETVRCFAARAVICAEEAGHSRELAGDLFANQENLTEELVVEFAEPFLDEDALLECTASEETRAKLARDVDLAWQWEPDGTPLVIVDGKQGTSFGPFLFAMILTGGDPDHPAFRFLPPPNPNAHMH